jgi:preprotein translocase subunit YajC
MIVCPQLLAQAPTTGAAPSQGSPAPIWIGMLLFIGVFFFISMRSQKREKTKTADMLGGLKKNDRVLTIGGIIGTVVNVRENEVVVKIDESTNTRVTFVKRSIQQVLGADGNP